MFNRGDKVVCVNMETLPSGKRWSDIYDQLPEVFDRVYTVRATTLIYNEFYGEYQGLLLEEVRNRPRTKRRDGQVVEPSFGAWRFRKVTRPPAKVRQMEEA